MRRETHFVFRDIKGRQHGHSVAVLPCLIGKLDLDLRGDFNAVKAIMKS